MMKIAILASGRGSNLQVLIDAWKSGQISGEIVAVGSDHEGVQALERAQKSGISCRAFPVEHFSSRVEQEKALLSWLKELQVELLVLAGYMRVLSKEFLEGIKTPVMNIHPSLLPAFPGLHAQRQALAYGVKVAGCTVHFVDEGMDSGPILLQEVVPVLPEDTEDTLAARILQVEHRIYPQAVSLVASGRVNRNGRKLEIL